MPPKKGKTDFATSAPKSKDAEAMVLFTDIRGFTKWSEANEVFARLEDYVGDFMKIIHKHFSSPAFVKGLGDGAMIVQTFERDSAPVEELLKEAMSKIQAVNNDFDLLCKKFAFDVGHATDLRLGWGVVRGAVKVLENDYVGSNLNKSARLCDVARPFGVVIDRDDFPKLSSVEGLKFFEQTRKLGGIGDEVRIWATEEVASRFVPREKLKETPEVHVAGMCIDTNDRRGAKILIAKRTSTRRLYPNLYEGCGGQLARSESFEAGVSRHFQLEMNISVRVEKGIHCFYEIKEADEPLIPGIRFLCYRVSDSDPRSANHSEIKWLFASELRNMSASEFIPGLKDDFIKLLEQYEASSIRSSPKKGKSN